MKAAAKLTTCTVTVRAYSGAYVARVEENGITASCTMSAEHAVRRAAAHALRTVDEDRVVLTALASPQHNRMRFTAALEG